MDANQEIISQLFENDARFRKLYEEHHILEKQLEQLNNSPYLSVEEELQKKKIQKMKLAGRDEMERMIRGLQPS
ncbi:YdcH family protein [Desulfuromonas thiophila]|jgi:uncharacterized protein YdcH (DUF465 family)|uniref:DUF465 domain-containing protein n=1 Tax=Desulfuromonas thiophila TaxID=57664 RepID=A0A1G7ARA6_9BACT|nr:YdcH family protein [Desulfuromonas thiophila]MCK9171867.1 YdcH family protein [Desulfuromonas thiophila]MDD3800816.1 YdcH family protein [Desulfuromonas thiophila]MDY0398509.1 YdcH family protein [Desulfuromonas thiophila]SDE16535.1 hypothetical protein SAMN05661003_104141 [Desulfuromonas thiophila]